ncbi:MAG TPA: alpha/beta hydrolase [Pyrinomonadaceae bacterium]|jgi:pimeloyl-ACP methyl ester carboxylesterase|nr:alpha/beta hydrolase [Pyrinomonadaceae bacterium]
MPKIKVNNLNINYEQQGSGEPLVLIPYLTGDNACYTFQVADYAKHFTCISFDPRGTGESDKPAGAHSTELYADDVSAFMRAIGIERAHVMGLSLGAATSLWLAAKYPEKVKTLSVHSAWTKTDLFIKTTIESWQILAHALGNVQDLVIKGIFPWCLTPDLFVKKPEYIESLAAFVKSRPVQPLEAFDQQVQAVLTHDVESQLNKISAPTLITFGRYDLITSVRFAEPLRSKIPNTEMIVFEDASHTPIYEKVDEFNQRTIAFLESHSGKTATTGTT